MAILRTPKRLSVSTWALHPLVGTCAPGRPGNPETSIMASHEGSIDLLDVPAALADHDYRTMELCHFHIPNTDAKYLAKLRHAIESAGVELWSTLIDDGDINDSEHGDRDRAWIEGWIDHASALGSRCVRVVPGKQPPTADNIKRTTEQLAWLSDYARERGVQVLAENWFATFSTPHVVAEVLEALNGKVGLCFDFGNWGGDTKYTDLGAIARFADSCHAKCHFEKGVPDAQDFEKCLNITHDAGFSGPYTLVHGEPGRVWESLETQRQLVAPFLM